MPTARHPPAVPILYHIRGPHEAVIRPASWPAAGHKHLPKGRRIPYVLNLHDIDHTDAVTVGCKAANLGRLSRVPGVRVPVGFCVTTEAFDRNGGGRWADAGGATGSAVSP